MSGKTYWGQRLHSGCMVRWRRDGEGVLLPIRLDLWNHSPNGFEWGYGGSGPAQLALALLAHVLEDAQEAIDLHQAFKWKVVGGLPHDQWTLSEEEILAVVSTIRKERKSKV